MKEILNSFEFPESANYKTSSSVLRKAIYKAFNGKCFYTGTDISINDMHIDHVLPVSKGGPDNYYNYVPTTQRINGKKTNHFDEKSAVAILSLIRTAYVDKVKIIVKKSKQKLKRKEYSEFFAMFRIFGLRRTLKYISKNKDKITFKIKYDRILILVKDDKISGYQPDQYNDGIPKDLSFFGIVFSVRNESGGGQSDFYYHRAKYSKKMNWFFISYRKTGDKYERYVWYKIRNTLKSIITETPNTVLNFMGEKHELT